MREPVPAQGHQRPGRMEIMTGIRLFDALEGFAAELLRYLTGSPRSRLRQLRRLRDLDDHLLADIGLTRDDVRTARAGPFDACRQVPEPFRITEWSRF